MSAWKSPQDTTPPPDVVRRAAAGEAVDVWIYSAFPKDNWKPRQSADFTHAEHPGTAIKMENQIYEVRVMEETAEPGFTLKYGLTDWDPRHAVRVVVPFTHETQAQAGAAIREAARSRSLRLAILGLFPLAGLMPTRLQRGWEKRTGLNMTVLAAASALSIFSVVLCLGHFLDNGQLSLRAQRLLFLVGADSLVRLLWMVISRGPRGSFFIALPYALWHAVVDPPPARKRPANPLVPPEADRIVRREAARRLEIRSRVFDDDLTGPDWVRFEGALYRPLDWRQQGEGLSRRMIYELEPVEGQPPGRLREFAVPRSAERQKAVERLTARHDRTRILAVLWGFYPAAAQRHLEAVYGFPAASWTARTSWLLLVLVLLEIALVLSARTYALDLVVPVYFVLESLYRLAKSVITHQPAGSLVGYILKWLIHPPE
jgi:hypothetical protein